MVPARLFAVRGCGVGGVAGCGGPSVPALPAGAKGIVRNDRQASVSIWVQYLSNEVRSAIECMFLAAVTTDSYQPRVTVVSSLGGRLHALMSKAAGQTLGTAHRKVLHPSVLRSCTVWPVPILFDNYAYLVVDHRTKIAVGGSVVLFKEAMSCTDAKTRPFLQAAVDPAVPEIVLEFADKIGVRCIGAVLTTHGHHDHAGGNARLKELLPDAEILGPVEKNPIPVLYVQVSPMHGNTGISLSGGNYRTFICFACHICRP